MRLQEFEKYKKIIVQCHDNPDADALASGFALCKYFNSKNIDTKLIYSGRNKIQKANLVLMMDKLHIEAEFIPFNRASEYVVDELLITVDCQYGAGNVTKIAAPNVAIIDHHQIEIDNLNNTNIKSDIGSCSTVVWSMLKEEAFDIAKDEELSTALYYGLLTDTNNFVEVKNPIDRDMIDELSFNSSYITLFCNSNISLKELEIAGIAMIRISFNEDYNYAVIKAQPCDPNILGLISDFLLQVDKIFSCVVYNEVPGGFKLSVRSCVREVDASELAGFITADMGSGGGHYQKAGGFISQKLYQEKYGSLHSEAYFNNRMNDYFEQYELIYADQYVANINSMIKYKKKNMPIGYVIATDIMPVGTPITIRTIEGDMDLIIDDDLVIIIGIEGEVYPNRMEKFEKSYKMLDIAYDYETMPLNTKYAPVVKNRQNGETVSLIKYAHTCESTGNVCIYAKPLMKRTKVFTNWDKNRYMVGKKGDMLAIRTDDLHDVYVVDKVIFNLTYDEA